VVTRLRTAEIRHPAAVKRFVFPPKHTDNICDAMRFTIQCLPATSSPVSKWSLCEADSRPQSTFEASAARTPLPNRSSWHAKML
jgi:hypothetical protein